MKLHSLSISGVMTLNLHALNNEGSEGNALMTRMVQIVDQSGVLQPVNAISGDMFKHIQAEHLFLLGKESGLKFCAGCADFDPNRINRDDEFASSFKEGASDDEILAGTISKCAGDDCEGILITKEIGGKKRAIGRKSAIEFGWVVGKPESTHTESYFHVKYDRQKRGKGAGDESGANIGQNIFYRPASSGQYAVVLTVEAYRVGRNDITLLYDIDAEERKNRINALLRSVLATFIRPAGAHRNTQSPHVVDFSGIITTSESSMPAPTISPLNSSYAAEVSGIVSRLNQMEGNQSLMLSEFNGLQEFTSQMADIIENLNINGA